MCSSIRSVIYGVPTSLREVGAEGVVGATQVEDILIHGRDGGEVGQPTSSSTLRENFQDIIGGHGLGRQRVPTKMMRIHQKKKIIVTRT